MLLLTWLWGIKTPALINLWFLSWSALLFKTSLPPAHICFAACSLGHSSPLSKWSLHTGGSKLAFYMSSLHIDLHARREMYWIHTEKEHAGVAPLWASGSRFNNGLFATLTLKKLSRWKSCLPFSLFTES